MIQPELPFAVALPPAPLTVDQRFARFHVEHPEVYALLVRLARLRLRRGFKRCGARALYEVARWTMELRKGTDFKLNNNYTSRYARLIMAQEEDLAGIFEIRRPKGE